ncbi:MAG: hypothetical protein U1D68_10590 [Arthrobacter sp.]|nr:hypothetical protein [Arthrobacter sp.]MDZ4351351.1 hypothetical protein [Arthrobacter sp.]
MNKPLRARIAYSGGPAIISIASYMSWEIARYLLETETPGKFGTYNMEAAA